MELEEMVIYLFFIECIYASRLFTPHNFIVICNTYIYINIHIYSYIVLYIDI